MEQHTHFFYALELPGEIKDLLEGAAFKLKAALPFKTWVNPHDLHITMAFLGNADGSKMEASNQLIESALRRHSVFDLQIDHLGIFGRKDSPRIFWAGLKDSTNLNEVRDDVFSACLASGFSLETRPFSPHITMARKWAGEFPFTYKQLEELNPLKGEKITFNAKRVVLYKTHLGKSPKYEPITIFPLVSPS
jgi:RNA 2',3'-cyclic 3'-phosphodiesterase